MKRTMTLIAAAFVVMMAVVGCGNPTQPDPDPVVPDPVKVYLTGSESFTRVDAAGTLAMTDIYQWDTDADGTVDSPAAYFTGSNVSVTLENTEWTITVGGDTYVNSKWLSGRTSFVETESAPVNMRFFRNNSIGDEANCWLLTNAGIVGWATRRDDGTAAWLGSFSTYYMNGTNTITDTLGWNITATWQN